MEKSDLIGRILTIAGDYRQGEIVKFDEKHVLRWIDQFMISEQHKNIILYEVAHMLEKYYISRASARSNILEMLNFIQKEKSVGCPVADVNFLQTQTSGKSQYEILVIVDEILNINKGISTKECGGSNVYLYLDDCVYTGNTWKHDIRDSAQLAQARSGSTLFSYHLAIYNKGFGYAKSSYIDGYMSQKGVSLMPFRKAWLNDDRFSSNRLDIFWPKYVGGNGEIDAFVQKTNVQFKKNAGYQRSLFRTNQADCANIFTSPVNRDIVEQAFLAAGAKMFCAAAVPARSMRPMGFEVLSTIGFGAPIVTWRNIANNCPLALWYGNPAYGSNHPLGIWYPLFPRKI